MVERYSSETRLNQAGNLIADATGTHASHPVYTTLLDNALRRINLSQPGTAKTSSESLAEDSESNETKTVKLETLVYHTEHTENFESYFYTLVCYRWFLLFEITNFYDQVYNRFDHLKTKGCYCGGG